MENNSFLLRNLSSFIKRALLLYFLLTSLGFGVAATLSYDRYQFNHQITRNYYLGDPAEGELAFAKPFSQLVGVTHVHSFMMPLVFCVMWLALSGTSLNSFFKNLFLCAGALSVFTYCAAPYALRFYNEKMVFLFTVGGVGLFASYFLPLIFIVKELFNDASSKN